MSKYFLFLPAVFLFSCGGPEELDYEETEYDIKIKEYLSEKGWEAERQESGLYIYTSKPGSDEKPDNGSYLTINYEGRLLDETVFDGTSGQTVTFNVPLGDISLEGWREGIPAFGKGGKGTLIIPPDLGFGAEDIGPIPGNSVLVYDIEIVDFNDTPPPPPDYSPEIDQYIEENNLGEFTKTESGLYMQISKPGSAEKPTLDHFLTLNYEGYLLDGTSFDGTGGVPTTFSFPLGQTIEGWREGIPNIGKGGKGKLIIPPYLGYGERGSQGIPPNSILVFEFEIIDFSLTPPQN